MAKLAILGHETRGKEIIELLKMFGAQHGIYGISHYPNYPHMIYYINGYNLIEACDRTHHLEYVQYSLEEFLENFPYKIGDKVLINDDENDVYTVKSMEWDECFNRVAYRIEAVDGIMDDNNWFAHEMHAAVSFNTKKEETMEERKYADLRIDVDQDDKLATEVTIDGNKITPPNNYLIGKITKVDNGMLVEFVKKQQQYPKDYVECCDVMCYRLLINPMIGHKTSILETFQKLLICRDAYWKIAGEQMGLGKPWEPNWKKPDERKYCITNTEGNIAKWVQKTTNKILAFPTEEMRNIFYENFKKLIEQCKEFL